MSSITHTPTHEMEKDYQLGRHNILLFYCFKCISLSFSLQLITHKHKDTHSHTDRHTRTIRKPTTIRDLMLPATVHITDEVQPSLCLWVSELSHTYEICHCCRGQLLQMGTQYVCVCVSGGVVFILKCSV